ncbi:MAG: hypothetical protein HYW90_04920 [Candidatus Sungbacteria bacterium]|nr:hypothetical protein [Candidatus Sungbacteria bacterium]
MEGSEKIYDLGRKIRDFINGTRVKAELLKNKPLFYQLCSCMDMVEDTEVAIDAFAEKEKPEKGEVYLEIFGLLQALFLQQDAALHLAEALEFEVGIDEYPRLKEIREIRNDAVGHPTKRGNPVRSWNFIVQHRLSYSSFEILAWHSPEGHTRTVVKTREIINGQQKYIAEILEKTFTEVKHRDAEYKSNFKMKKITDTLPDTMGYWCEKMYSAVSHIDELNLGEFGATSAQNALKRFEEELASRGITIDTYPGIGLTFSELKYPLEKLQDHFSSAVRLEEEAAYIFVDFVRIKLKELKKMADELDSEFNGE